MESVLEQDRCEKVSQALFFFFSPKVSVHLVSDVQRMAFLKKWLREVGFHGIPSVLITLKEKRQLREIGENLKMKQNGQPIPPSSPPPPQKKT